MYVCIYITIFHSDRYPNFNVCADCIVFYAHLFMYVCMCVCMYVCMKIFRKVNMYEDFFMYVCVCEGYLGQIARDVPFRAIQLPSYELTKKWYSSFVAFRPLR